MAFQQGGSASNFCLGTTGGVYLPNFGAAITGPPLTIASFVKVFDNKAKVAPGAGAVLFNNTQCNNPEDLQFNLCYENNPRGKDFLILGIGATFAGRKYVLSYDTHPFTRLYVPRYRKTSAVDADGCCCDYVDEAGTPVAASETGCLTLWGYTANSQSALPRFMGGIFNSNTSDPNTIDSRNAYCRMLCSSYELPYSQKRFVFRYYDNEDKYFSSCSVSDIDGYVAFRSSGAIYDRNRQLNPIVGLYSGCGDALGAGNCIGAGRGTFHSCWLKPTGEVGCTGINTIGQCNVPASLQVAQGATALMKFGISHSLALYRRNDGQTGLTGWGSNSNGQLGFPLGITVISAEGGMAHTVILRRNGGITAFGANVNHVGDVSNQCVLNSTLRAANAAKKVAAGLAFNVAILANDGVTAWGDNTHGQCDVPAGLTAVEIACGGYHALALKHDGTVVAWGRGNEFQGCGECQCKQSVVPPGITFSAENGNPVVAIRASLCNSFAVTKSGQIIRWGGDCLTDAPYGPNGFLPIQLQGPCDIDVFGDLLMTTTVSGASAPEVFVVSNHNAVGKFALVDAAGVGPESDWIYVAGVAYRDSDPTFDLQMQMFSLSTIEDNTYKISTRADINGIIQRNGVQGPILNGYTLPALSNVLIGNHMTNDYGWGRQNVYLDGAVAESAIWNAALTPEELKLLAKGVKPIYIRPDKLVFYAPLLNNNVIDYAGGRPIASYNSEGIPSSYNQTGFNSATRSGLTFHSKRIG